MPANPTRRGPKIRFLLIFSQQRKVLASKNKKSKPGIIQFSEVNLKIFDDEEREIQNLIGWTD